MNPSEQDGPEDGKTPAIFVDAARSRSRGDEAAFARALAKPAKGKGRVAHRRDDERSGILEPGHGEFSGRGRVWNRILHPRGRCVEFEAFASEHGRDELRKLAHGGMLETERTVRKMGLKGGSPRWLRFWSAPETADE